MQSKGEEIFVQILKIGDGGAEVSLLQKGLVRAGFGPLRLDGIFGPATERALQAFQKANGLRPDGIFGPLTESALTPWFTGFLRHTVTAGDTLWRIAWRYGTTLAALDAANPEVDPFDLRIGSKLTVPLGFAVTPTDIPWCSALAEYCVRGLLARYPSLRGETIGESALSRPLQALTAGDGPRRVIFTAAHHANEWTTAPLVMKYAETLMDALAQGGSVYGVTAEELFFRTQISFVPTVNPDGVDLVTGALGEPYRSRAADIARGWPSIPFPEGWKANLQGVDLNLQYPAGWETARAIKTAQGFDRPAPRDYVGPAPLSAPESAALAAFTEALDPDLVLAYHTQGNVIYWQFMGSAPPGSRELGLRLAAASGYTLENEPYESSFAGYKDWFLQDFDRPGYTVEAGVGENPLPPAAFDAMWEANLGLMTLAALGTE